jgi:hypothetical protein
VLDPADRSPWFGAELPTARDLGEETG